MNELYNSFLSLLIRKKAAVIKAGLETKKDVSAALNEVDRQIQQALKGGDPTKGKGVTKSGGDD